MTDPPGRLHGVEVARGLAALAVVRFHANASAPWFGGPSWAVFRPLAHGVDFFFVLSGFIMAHANGGELGQPGSARPFLIKRAIRLLPLLWLAVATLCVGRLVLGGELEWRVILRSALLLPVDGQFVPLVVWTLRHEALFYVVFAIALWSRPVGFALALVGVAGSLVQLILGVAGRPLTGDWAVVFSAYNLDFAVGALVAVAARRRPPLWPLVWLWGGLVALAGLLAVIVVGDTLGSYVTLVDGDAMLMALGLGLACAAILRGLIAIEGRWRPGAVWIRLGAGSYAIYLFHTLSNAAVQRAVVHLPEWILAFGGGHLVLIVTGVLVGDVLDRQFDARSRRALTRWLIPARGRPTAGRAPTMPL